MWKNRPLEALIKDLDANQPAMEGFAALTGGEPSAVRACVPALAEMLGVKATLLGDLVAVAGRDADNLTALCKSLDMTDAQPILECLVNLYSREQPRVRVSPLIDYIVIFLS